MKRPLFVENPEGKVYSRDSEKVRALQRKEDRTAPALTMEQYFPTKKTTITLDRR